MISLQLVRQQTRRVNWGDSSSFDAGDVTLARSDVMEALAVERPVIDVRLHIAEPDAPHRINRVLDVLEPRYKLEGTGVTFPGIAGAAEGCGEGVTVSLEGLALVATGTFVKRGGAFEQEDCLIDMAGNGARYSPFSRTTNLVLEYGLEADADHAEAERAIREANVRLARWLARLAADAPRREITEFGAPGRYRSGPPRIAYVCQLISEGCLHDTLLHGRSTKDLEPRWVSPQEMADGALVSADFHYACQRVPTYLYQRNPIVEALMSQWDSLALPGVLLTVRRETDEAKRQAAKVIVRKALGRGVDALITHPAVGGNAHLDALYVIQEAEQQGMASAMVVQEMAGANGADPGLVDFVEEADLLISTGNREEFVPLSRPDVVLGGEHLLEGGHAASTESVPLRLLCAATSQVGGMRMRGAAA